MKSLKKTFTRKLRKTPSNKSSSKSNSSGSLKHITDPHEKKYKKTLRKLGIDKKSVANLAKQIDELTEVSNATFKKTRKLRSPSPNSPLILTIKNLNTGKKVQATVIKDLNKKKYEFLELSK